MSRVKLSASDFVHLHNHTEYSLLDGLTKVPAMVERIKDLGMTAVAITDHGTLSGTIEFYKTAKTHKIKPIIGMEAYIAARSHTDKDPAKDKTYYHLTVLAMNNTGYQNLMKLSTIANLEGFYYKPRIDHSLLEKYNEGLIILSGCIGSEIGDLLRQEQHAKAKQVASWYQKTFGDRYYLEIQDHGHKDHATKWDEQVVVNQRTFKLSEELNIPCVLTSDAHYLMHDDQEAHEILLCVQTGSFLSDEARMSMKDFDLHVADPKEIIKRWGQDHPEIILNTKRISERVEVEVELGKILIPKFPVPKGENEKTYLRQRVYQGLAWRYAGVKEAEAAKLTEAKAKSLLSAEIKKKTEYELGVIDQMQFNGFFLIVADFTVHGKKQGIVFGPGRGSAASSIVAYALKITEIDPLAYNLLFERFLNPDRISMPDFDIDIQDSRRDEVINYCIDKYGRERVANIVTFGRMAARNAVRDVARVLQVPYGEADRLAKLIPPPFQGRHTPLQELLKTNADLKNEYKSSDQTKRVFDLAIQLEGTIRSHGVHAAGVVIAPDELIKFAPLEMAQKGVVATQYSMGPIEDLGLLKIDFLGLSNLTIIKNTLRIIKKVHGKSIDINNIPLDDPKTYELLQKGDTTGVFQLESAGMKRFLKELKPNHFTDIIAMVALYRPGPMAEFPRFIAGKNDPSTITYPHKSLEPILKDTYGVIVFQEQIIALLQLLAGYTPGEADLVRKAIGKKKRDIMQAEQPRFIAGCKKKGLNEAEAEKIWKLIQPFADYSFNKAHAVCYASIANQTAYLKANYPAAFMAALMTSDYDDTDRLRIEIGECQHLGLDVLLPDVKQSFGEFAIVPDKNQIRFGLNAIKNVGTGAVEEIIRARDEGGKFQSLEDFLTRVSVRVVNRKALESLIKAGALDSLAKRDLMLNNIDALLAFANRLQKSLSSGQTDLFSGLEIEAVLSAPQLTLREDGPSFSQREQLQWERELLGLYLSGQPLNEHQTYLKKYTQPINELGKAIEGQTVTVGGSVADVREITTKNGQKMAFVRLSDGEADIELVLFPSIYQQTADLWLTDHVVIAQGKLTSVDRQGNKLGESKVLVSQAKAISEVQEPMAEIVIEDIPDPVADNNPKAVPSQRLYIRLENSENQDLLLQLKRQIDNYTGTTEVVLVVGPDDSKQAIRLPMRVDARQDVIDSLNELVGQDMVRLG